MLNPESLEQAINETEKNESNVKTASEEQDCTCHSASKQMEMEKTLDRRTVSILRKC